MKQKKCHDYLFKVTGVTAINPLYMHAVLAAEPKERRERRERREKREKRDGREEREERKERNLTSRKKYEKRKGPHRSKIKNLGMTPIASQMKG